MFIRYFSYFCPYFSFWDLPKSFALCLIICNCDETKIKYSTYCESTLSKHYCFLFGGSSFIIKSYILTFIPKQSWILHLDFSVNHVFWPFLAFWYWNKIWMFFGDNQTFIYSKTLLNLASNNLTFCNFCNFGLRSSYFISITLYPRAFNNLILRSVIPLKGALFPVKLSL